MGLVGVVMEEGRECRNKNVFWGKEKKPGKGKTTVVWDDCFPWGGPPVALVKKEKKKKDPKEGRPTWPQIRGPKKHKSPNAKKGNFRKKSGGEETFAGKVSEKYAQKPTVGGQRRGKDGEKKKH